MPTAGGTFTREQVRNDPVNTNSLMGLYTNHCNLLDLAAVDIPENSGDRQNPFGITVFALCDSENIMCAFAEKFLSDESMKIAVCGLHKKGRALESQLTELGGEFVEHTKTSKNYRLYKLNTTPVKPGLIKSTGMGNNIEVDVYTLAKNKFGRFFEQVKSPLVLGDVELENGEIVKGFLCEPDAVKDAQDITDKGTF